MPLTRASLSINVGPNATFDSLAAITADLQQTLDFAHEVQSVVDRNDAAYSILRRRDLGPILDDFDIAPGYVRSEFLASLISSGSPFLRSSAFERAVDQRLAELSEDRIIRVESLQYSNPFNVKIKFDGSAIARILEIIRDWSAARRQADAIAREAEARATSYEEDLQFKRDVHDVFRRSLAASDLRIGNDEISALLTPDVQRSLGALVRADPEATLEVDDDPQ
jgi:hypothetical protein